MRSRRAIAAVIVLVLAVTAIYGQRRLRSFDDEEDEPLIMPADAGEKTEFVFTRLRYHDDTGMPGWRGYWTMDYPKADRQFVQGVRRLSRVHVRSVENVVDLDSDEIFNWPWIYAVEVGHWDLTDRQAKRLRDYLLRGGFLLVDDFHGTFEWEVFMSSLQRVFPDRSVIDIPKNDAAYRMLWEIDEKVQIPGIVMFRSGRTYERDGIEPAWRGVYDDRGRLCLAICHNMDIGDAWEHADWPQYPERYSSLAYRIGINYIVYSMTH